MPGVLNGAAITATTALALWCFGCCVAWDAGGVPDGWQPDAEGGGSRLQEVKKKVCVWGGAVGAVVSSVSVQWLQHAVRLLVRRAGRAAS